jgi:hypothetical protein
LQDPKAALALVSARPGATEGINGSTERNDEDPDLKRAQDLLALHSTVKLAHQDGVDKELSEARKAVKQVLRSL